MINIHSMFYVYKSKSKHGIGYKFDNLLKTFLFKCLRCFPRWRMADRFKCKEIYFFMLIVRRGHGHVSCWKNKQPTQPKWFLTAVFPSVEVSWETRLSVSTSCHPSTGGFWFIFKSWIKHRYKFIWLWRNLSCFKYKNDTHSILLGAWQGKETDWWGLCPEWVNSLKNC